MKIRRTFKKSQVSNQHVLLNFLTSLRSSECKRKRRTNQLLNPPKEHFLTLRCLLLFLLLRLPCLRLRLKIQIEIMFRSSSKRKSSLVIHRLLHLHLLQSHQKLQTSLKIQTSPFSSFTKPQRTPNSSSHHSNSLLNRSNCNSKTKTSG